MGLLNLFKLEKLKIGVYAEESRSGIPQDTFTVMFNPESYSYSYENKYQSAQGINTSGRSAVYSLSKPGEISFKLIIDGTGVSDFGIIHLIRPKDVYNEVQKFMEFTAYMDGEIHEPKFLRIIWGDLVFKCRLKSVNITYTLFDKSGMPLRAELDTAFIGDLEKSERLKLESKNSPDLTHIRVVKAHDTLPLLCEQIYGSQSYYLKVAEANGLNNFRNLIPGQQLFFPPIAK